MTKNMRKTTYQTYDYYCKCVGRKVRTKYRRQLVKKKKVTSITHRLECPHCGCCFLTWADWRKDNEVN